MKKLIGILFIFCFILTGCSFGEMMNTPTKRAEEFLGRYQKLDKEVLDQLDRTLDEDTTMSEEQKKEYRNLMKKQYQNLAYKVKNETIDGDSATVEIEIEVFDYNRALNDANKYLQSHKDEFKKTTSKTNTKDTTTESDDKKDESNKDNDSLLDDDIDESKFIDYKIKQMKDVKEKIKYTLNLTLTKKDKKWTLDQITETERQKIHGLYNY